MTALANARKSNQRSSSGIAQAGEAGAGIGPAIRRAASWERWRRAAAVQSALAYPQSLRRGRLRDRRTDHCGPAALREFSKIRAGTAGIYSAGAARCRWKSRTRARRRRRGEAAVAESMDGETTPAALASMLLSLPSSARFVVVRRWRYVAFAEHVDRVASRSRQRALRSAGYRRRRLRARSAPARGRVTAGETLSRTRRVRGVDADDDSADSRGRESGQRRR